MNEEIINRVANSSLITIDLEEWYPEGERVSLDIAPWLYEGIVLKEKDFRASVKDYDWAQYQDSFVSIYCSTDAIIPGWAYLLVSLQLNPYAQRVVVGSQEDLETLLYAEVIRDLPIEDYTDKPVIIKGCTHKPVPENAYVMLAQKLQLVTKSIQYGEACSSVPLFKKRR
jgi:hypothetical protein